VNEHNKFFISKQVLASQIQSAEKQTKVSSNRTYTRIGKVIAVPIPFWAAEFVTILALHTYVAGGMI